MRVVEQFLCILACVFAMRIQAESFHRIEEIVIDGPDSRVYVDDWNGDGSTELIVQYRLIQTGLPAAGQNLWMTRIYEARDHRWVVTNAFIHVWRNGEQFHSTRKPLTAMNRLQTRLEGDFDADGLLDAVVVELKESYAPDGTRSLRWKPGNTPEKSDSSEFEDILDEESTWSGGTRRLSALKAEDFDRDGTPEVVALIGEEGSASLVRIYGVESQWQAHRNGIFDSPDVLHDARFFLRGVQEVAPGKCAPVEAKLTRVSEMKHAPGVEGEIVTTYRFRVDIEMRNGEAAVDLAAWRNYISRWGIVYLYQDDDWDYIQALPDARFVPEADGLYLETEFLRNLKYFDSNSYKLWLECPFVERNPNPFGWFGTLVTPEIDVGVSSIWQEGEQAGK